MPLAAAGAAFGALGCVVGAAARDLRAASLVGVALVTPIVLVGLVPRKVSPLAADVSELLPFAPAARAFGAALFDSAPLSTALAASAHLLLLTAVLGARHARALQALSELTSTPRGSGASAVTPSASGERSRGDARGDARRPRRRRTHSSVLGPAPESVQP